MKTSSLIPASLLALVLAIAGSAAAVQVTIPTPAGSGAFGTKVLVLPNGNIVVTDPSYDEGAVTDIGAVHLYDGTTLALISTLKGSTAGDQIGFGGVTVLSNGNYVVASRYWDNGAATDAGAVTWCSATTGLNGVVSASNSLVGSSSGNQVGSVPVSALTNGNYVVASRYWDNGAATDVGAVTWGDGTAGTSGVVSVANSLVGSTSNDQIGYGITLLSNGNYVVGSPNWDNGAATNAGAVTWCSGTAATSGIISAANSLVGSTANDRIGYDLSITPLSNGNYVVGSPNWDNGAATNAGAVTWCDGTAGASGAVSAANSLVGSTANDGIGYITLLSNGNYVVRSMNWDNGAATNAGAVTWCSGTAGAIGAVSAANSLVGAAGNQIASGGVKALTNGNYVIQSSSAGIITWCPGGTASTGSISSVDSFYVSSSTTVTALTNGNYVIADPGWGGSRGAATWCNGTTGRSGSASESNSLYGGTHSTGTGSPISDYVGLGGVTALANGNYVVLSPNWTADPMSGPFGAATWGNGATGTTGAVSTANSLVIATGPTMYPTMYMMMSVHPLSNGNYVVRVGNGNPVFFTSALTWRDGTQTTSGVISSANSILAQSPMANYAFTFMALSDGNYLVGDPSWAGGVGGEGAVGWANGTTGRAGVLSASNALVGYFSQDFVGAYYFGSNTLEGTALADGNYVIWSPMVDTILPPDGMYLGGSDAGAVTLCRAGGTTVGPLSASNSVLGRSSGGGSGMNFSYDLARARLAVGDPSGNRVTLVTLDPSPDAPEITVEQPAGTDLTSGAATVSLGAVAMGSSQVKTFTVKNLGGVALTLGTPSVLGGNPSDFVVSTAGMLATVPATTGSTTFTVTFTPLAAGARSTSLRIPSDDGNENPFTITLNGQGLSTTQDTDGDGMNDAAEAQLAVLGFDWQVSQTAQVTAYYSNANVAGLYTTAQVQAINVGVPLLTKNPSTGKFKVTIAVKKSTDLVNFQPFPMTSPTTSINGQGEVEFEFTAPDDAAFYRLESR